MNNSTASEKSKCPVIRVTRRSLPPMYLLPCDMPYLDIIPGAPPVNGGGSNYVEIDATIQRIRKMNFMVCAYTFPEHPYSSESLKRITTFIDALPKPLGFSYQDILDMECRMIIPAEITQPFDLEEMLQPLRIWRTNMYGLQCPLIGVALVLLFMHRCIVGGCGRFICWERVVEAIVYCPDQAFCDTVISAMNGRRF